MPTLILSSELRALIKKGLEVHEGTNVTHPPLNEQPGLFNFFDAVKKILHQEKYVHIRGIPVLSNEGWRAFTSCFGLFYGVVERTDIKIDCHYSACSINPLTLHNDDAIDEVRQPKYGFIQVTNEDPLHPVANGIVVVRELVQQLRYEAPELLKILLSHPVPMFSHGVNYEEKDGESIIINSPILYKSSSGEYQIRFDHDRIRRYYQEMKKKQPFEEGKMIYDFLQAAQKIKQKITLSYSDLLVHDNLCTLHDRDACNIELYSDGTRNTRHISVSFARAQDGNL